MEEFFEEFPNLSTLNEGSFLTPDPNDGLADSLFGLDQLSLSPEPQSPAKARPFAGPCAAGGPNRKRPNRKDDFDYEGYIKAEMTRHSLEDAHPQVQKKMIQKIRNRMSAQRSRTRQRNMLDALERENGQLYKINGELWAQVQSLTSENVLLKQQLEGQDRVKRSPSTSENDEAASFSSEDSLLRRQRLAGPGFSKGLLLLGLAALACLAWPAGRPEPAGPVLMSGVVPLMTRQITHKAPTGRHLQTLEAQCRRYCDAATAGRLEGASKALRPYGKVETQIELASGLNLSQLICFDPQLAAETSRTFKILVNNSTKSMLNFNDLYLAHLQKYTPPDIQF